VGPLISGENLVDVVECACEHKIVVVKGDVVIFIEILDVFVVNFLYFLIVVDYLDG